MSAVHGTDTTEDLDVEVDLSATFDEGRAKAFAGQMIDTLNKGMVTLMISLGNRTGLFDTLAAAGPSTSTELADASGLNERYVREWLAAMATAKIVTYEEGRFVLPAEHAAFTTRVAGPNNLAQFAEFAPVLGAVHDDIADCFRNGGGIGYDHFVPGHHVIAQASAPLVDANLLDVTLHLAEGLIERLEEGIEVMDVGCGEGHAVNVMADRFPNSRFVGLDFSEPAIEAAREEAVARGVTNATFVLSDARSIDETARFGLITTFDAIHDQAEPAKVLSNIRRALTDDGVYLAIDINASSDLANNLEHPLGPFFYTISTMHCMTVSLADDGAGLGTMWGHEVATKMLGEAGFENIDVKHVEGDMVNTYYVCRPD